MITLNDRERQFLVRHFTEHHDMTQKMRVLHGPNLASVFDPKTKRLHGHTLDPRCCGRQELVFESAASRATTLTRHPLKFWDVRRRATPRELARLQGFPETFVPPTACVTALFGNAVAVPCAAHALACVGADVVPPTTFLDLCSGIGGFHVAAKATWPDVRCVGASEIKKEAIRCYQTNFPGTPALGDLRGQTAWPSADLLTAGFPCQPFSRPLKTERATHPDVCFYEHVLRVIDTVGPRMVVLENVRSMLRTGVEHLRAILQALEARGYHTAYGCLDASAFGLPQQRHRLYILARMEPSPQLSPPPAAVSQTLGAIMEPTSPPPSPP
tara:strand:- start:760 stop:1743 length:984 start_codon:yes stop_codon:yes gene_type:complete